MKSQKNKNKRLSFEALSKVIDASIQIGQPSILLVDDNDTGKSKLIETISSRHKNAVFFDRIDMGGIRHLVHAGIFNEFRTLCLSDMNSIFSRRYEIIQSTLAELNNLIDGKVSASGDYQSVQKFKGIADFKKAMKIPLQPMSVIIGMTPKHLEKISYSSFNDFNTRFVVIEAEREEDFYVEDIDWNEYKKFDRIDNAKVQSRKDRWKTALEKISTDYKMVIPVKLWNKETLSWEYPYPFKMTENRAHSRYDTNTNTHIGSEHEKEVKK
jgi:hypothetical protein